MVSQTQLYGELLTSEQYYHKEVSTLPTLTEAEQATLIQQAQAGDGQAQNALIESCLSYIEYWATYYARLFRFESTRLEPGELIGIGNMTLVERFDTALTKRNPCAYLKGAAKHTMRYYCVYHKSAITTPDDCTGQDIAVESIQAPRTASQATLEDILVDESPLQVRDFAPLYRALEVLTDYQRVIVRHYYHVACEADEEKRVGDECKESRSTLKGKFCGANKEKALEKLRWVMPSPSECREVYTVAQACDLIGVSNKSLDNLFRERGIRPLMMKSGLYLKEDVDRLAQEWKEKKHRQNPSRECVSA